MKRKRINQTRLFFGIIALVILGTPSAHAHFGMLIPSDTMVTASDSRDVVLELSFSHPMELVGMELMKPNRFGVISNGHKVDLKSRLESILIMDEKAWRGVYPIKRPGIYQFFMEPEPYWEPAEDCFIIHYTKSLVAAFGDDEGWDHEIGLKTEIVPLSRPLGIYAGNAFQGIVKLDGSAVPFAMIEVEYYNKDGKATAPNDLMVTQSIKADQNGVFTYVVPKAGWWGFAALNTADYTLKDPSGLQKSVEIGAVIWIYFENWMNQ